MANSEAQTQRGVSSGSKDKTKFQPEQHLQSGSTGQYLPLKWRLAWLRAEHPQAQIITRLVSQQADTVLFRAVIKLPDGALATGWGAAQVDNANLNYFAQAEDSALLRALLTLGYGTDYASELDLTEQPAATIAPLTVRTNGAAVTPVEPVINAPGNGTANRAEPDEDEAPEAAIAVPEPARPPAKVVLETPTVEYKAEPEPTTELEPTPEPASRPLAVSRRPASLPATETTATVASGPVIGSASVEERIKFVSDERLRLYMKEIYYEARRKFNLNEDKVDERSQKRYGVPVFELDEEEAEEFLERIRTSGSRESR